MILRLRAPGSVINKEFEEPFAQLLPGHLNIIRGLESQRNAGLIARKETCRLTRINGEMTLDLLVKGYSRFITVTSVVVRTEAPPVCFL